MLHYVIAKINNMLNIFMGKIEDFQKSIQKLADLIDPLINSEGLVRVNSVKINSYSFTANQINWINGLPGKVTKLSNKSAGIKIVPVHHGQKVYAPNGTLKDWQVFLAPTRFGSVADLTNWANPALLKLDAYIVEKANHWETNIWFYEKAIVYSERKNAQQKTSTTPLQMTRGFLLILPSK